MSIAPLNSGIFFTFVDEVTNHRFVNSTGTTIVVTAKSSEQTALARWAKVKAVGPEVVDVKVNDFILIEPGMWTIGFSSDGTDAKEARLWKTNEDKVMLVSNKPGTVY